MSQILIIDIQADYKKWIWPGLEDNIREITKNYSSIVYLWDDTDNNDVYSQMPTEWMDEELFYDSLIQINKQYGFFRNFMDAGVDDEDIVKLAIFLIKHKLSDWREIEDNLDIKNYYLQEFKDSDFLNYKFNDYSFYIPHDLIDSFDGVIKSGVTLVGGARFRCLKEISLLLQVLNISHVIDENFTYN